MRSVDGADILEGPSPRDGLQPLALSPRAADLLHRSLTTPRPRSSTIAVRRAARDDGVLDAQVWRAITALLGVSQQDMRIAQTGFDLFGGPLRRTLLERLAKGPRRMNAQFLAEICAKDVDCHHRLRALIKAKMVVRGRLRTYLINPSALLPLRQYVDVLMTAGALYSEVSRMDFDLDLVLEALSSSMRRRLFEAIVIRPRRILDLVDMVPVTRQGVAHHVRVLAEAGLVTCEGTLVSAATYQLPPLRTYFDRLWLEASLGETWLTQRYSTSVEARQ